MPRDERDERGDTVPVVGAERVAAGAGGGLLRRLHGRAAGAAVRVVRYARSYGQAGRAAAPAAIADGAAGNAGATDRGPAHDDRHASDGHRERALAHGTTGDRNGAAGAKSPSTYADGPPAPANTAGAAAAAGADGDRTAADGHS